MSNEVTHDNKPQINQAEQHSKEHRTMAMLLYLSGLVSSFIGPLIIWAIMKDDSSLIDNCGKEALNLYISYFIYSAVSAVLCIILIGFALLFIIAITMLIFIIIAAVKAYEGNVFKFPLIIRFIQ
jgi:uncharacterized protein